MKKYLILLVAINLHTYVCARGKVYDMPGYGSGDFGWFWAIVILGVILYFVFDNKKK